MRLNVAGLFLLSSPRVTIAPGGSVFISTAPEALAAGRVALAMVAGALLKLVAGLLMICLIGDDTVPDSLGLIAFFFDHMVRAPKMPTVAAATIAAAIAAIVVRRDFCMVPSRFSEARE